MQERAEQEGEDHPEARGPWAKAIDWGFVFDNYSESGDKKFTRVVNNIPWTPDVDDNLWMTVEWLYRNGRVIDVRLAEDPVLYPVKEGWYMSEAESGQFIHICYPQDLLKFRTEYEGLRNLLLTDTLCQSQVARGQEIVKQALRKLWMAWNCLGVDGNKVDPASLEEPDDEDALRTTAIVPYKNWPREWKQKCPRCSAALPKNLQIWVKLKHGKLKDAR